MRMFMPFLWTIQAIFSIIYSSFGKMVIFLEDKKEKKKLTPEERKAKIKEKIQGFLFAMFFLVIFIAAFAIWGMQSPMFR